MGTIVAVLKDRDTKKASVNLSFRNLDLTDSVVLITAMVLKVSEMTNIPVVKVLELVQAGIKKGA